MNSAGVETVLHSFVGTNGWSPNGALVRDSAGNLYGTTTVGGNTSCDDGAGCGTVFKLTPTGTFTTLHMFSGPDGYNPNAGLILDSSGNLDGTTYRGGPYAHGTVFKLDSSANDSLWVPMLDSAGNLYGTAPAGGSADNGVVYKIIP